MIKLLASWAKKMAGKLTDDLRDPKLSASLASEFGMIKEIKIALMIRKE